MIFSGLFLIKIAITLAVVIGLSVVAERVSPKIAGILAGYPHGIAIALYFIGVEQGASFAAQSAVYAIGGLAANLAMCYAYFRLCNARTWRNILITATGSVIVFLLASAALQPIELTQALASGVTLVVIILIASLMKHTADMKIAGKPKVGFGAVLVRGGLASVTVLLITGLANVVGPAWSGLLAGFPIATFPLLLILHHGYGP
ncbi:MAG: hypothetical protein OIF38_04150, partial [Cellvibrionaceae bacterium]|nr:hypothetical protein [Cellvibrionaceae bacterium]